MNRSILVAHAGPGRRSIWLAALCAAVTLVCWQAIEAEAAEIVSYNASVTSTQAGAHPDAQLFFQLATENAQGPAGQPGAGCTNPGGYCTVIRGGTAKDIRVTLPRGLFGNPQALAKCTVAQLDRNACPGTAQVGVARVARIVGGRVFPPQTHEIYNMVPQRGVVAQLGLKVVAVMQFITVRLGPGGDYRVETTVPNIFTGQPVVSSELVVWGDPASPSHDAVRKCYGVVGCPWDVAEGGVGRPFLVNPSECGIDGWADIAISTYQAPDVWATSSSTPQQITGCESLEFTPSVEVAPTTGRPDAPTGLNVGLRFPQRFDDPDALEAPPLRDAVVDLPEGLTINPASASGLEACPDDRLNLTTREPVSCPPGSRIGSVTATSPVLEERLSGGVFVRPQASRDPESGDLFRIAIVLDSERYGISVRLPGRVFADRDSGRVRAVFADNPQLPVEQIELTLKSGPRAPLATPADCGRKTVGVALSAWSGQQADLADAFDIACEPGLGGFAPAFDAGAVDPTAGARTAFALTIDKPDGQAPLDGLSMKLPRGLVADLRGKVGERVGSAAAFAGPGSQPYRFPGDVYLEGPYGDAPFSLRTVVPAKAGPFDLGEVVVRQKIYVDPVTAAVTVVSDPLPTIVEGVPVRLQRLEVDVDRPGFVINPTSCREQAVTAELRSARGQTAPVSTTFQVSACRALDFAPRMAMRLTGRKQTRTGGHPAFTAVLSQRASQANVARAKVTMPRSVVLDPTNTVDPKMLCGYDEALKADCPASSAIGSATAVSPVLNRPLTGDVHLVQGIKFGKAGNRIRTTPSLLVKLRGEVAIDLRGQTSTERGTNRLVTTFASVPDAPVSRFAIRIAGGRKGILVVTRTARRKLNLCSAAQVADVETDGQNGRRADFAIKVDTPCARRARAGARR